MSTHTPSNVDASRHLHRKGTDADGNKFLAIAMSNEKAGTVSLRILSIDGQAPTPCFYFPAGPAAEMPTTSLAKSVGIELEMEEDTTLTGDSTKWSDLHLLRKLKIKGSKTKKDGEGQWVNETTYQHCWYGWEFTIKSCPCLSKNIANTTGAFTAFDKAFPKCVRLLAEDAATQKSKKIISWD